MAKASPLQSNFVGGEFSPLLYGRVDSERYKSALSTCKNFYPTIQGALVRRSGTEYVAALKSSTAVCRLVEFEFSTTQAYIIEFGNLYLRFYKDHGQIQVAGVAYEVVTTYATADLFQLKFTQSADILYITHPSYAPRKLTRTGHTSWTLTVISFLDGPYLSTNTTTTTFTPSAATGAGVTLTASSVTGVNDGLGFQTTDVGRLVRMKEGSVWGYAAITGRTSTTVVTITVVNTLTNTSAKATWRMGLYSTTTGFPGAVTFHEDRLFFGGSTYQPQRFDASCSGDYENFAPTANDGTVAANNALGFSLNANDVNVIRWMASDEKGLLIGTVGGEWPVRPSSQSEALSPTNVTAKRSTSYGSANIQPAQAGKASLMVQSSGKKVRELSYFYDVDGFQAPDLTQLAEHITQTGIVELAYQKEPQSLVWGCRNDGVLIGMTYERDQDSLKVGWHRHILGGYSDAAGSDAVVESVAVIPSPDGTREELWMIVQRYVNGAVKRYVEYMTKMFEEEDLQRDAFFVDCGLTYDDPLDITGATKANPVVVTSVAHGLSNGNKIIITDVLGMTELNDNTYLVANVAANTFELTNLSGININGTSYGTYVIGGEARKMITTISGLDHLEGQTVSILADGSVRPDAVVTAGAIVLTTASGTVTIGLPYNSDAQMLRMEAGAMDGTALGKTRRTHRVGFLLHRSLGLKIGMDFDDLDELTFRRSSDLLTRAVPLFSGMISETIEADYDTENQLCWRQSQPLPSMILAVMPILVTQDR